MKQKKTFKVLSIDGGGIKGLYSATILNKIEKDLIKKTNDKTVRIVDYFDLICGTSTGGLIALALSLGISTDEICKFYTNHGPKIFRWSKGVFPMLKQTLFWGKFNDKKLKKALVEILKEKKIGDSRCLLCIPTFDVTHGTYEIFKYDHKEGHLSRDNDLLMTDVALATSAAPTYFPVAQLEKHDNRQYIDGGIWANNPSLIGYTEAKKYFIGDGKYNNIQLLSLSSLNIGNKLKPFARKRRSFIGWRSRLFDLTLVAQSEFVDLFLSSLHSERADLDYYRINSAKVESSHVKHIELDRAKKNSIALMKQFGNDMYHNIKHDIKPFFQTRKTYITKNR
ncbi:CBASS cGAMP-activated phospholipase [Flavobacterium sp. N2038]|uniref:CBASS cGAMP-activated phospholipase n=1 Tax=Flavobacterium sp. N2038 TaxID=2986829 RepID=UPI0022259851|nr:CBASS cGAMP-activated phospholipase [Flavobacterium sp. N2038]